MPNARVAVIDDDRMVREMLELGLSREGYDVRTATDGLAALELVRRFDPELIVLDIMMPKIDGITLLPRLREITQAPILMLTAKGGTEDKVRPLSRSRRLSRQAVRLRRADRSAAGQTAPPATDRRERPALARLSRSTRKRARHGGARNRSSSRSASSICLKSSCANRAACSAKITCWRSSGVTISKAVRISSKPTSRICAQRSTGPASPARLSAPFAG